MSSIDRHFGSVIFAVEVGSLRINLVEGSALKQSRRENAAPKTYITKLIHRKRMFSRLMRRSLKSIERLLLHGTRVQSFRGYRATMLIFSPRQRSIIALKLNTVEKKIGTGSEGNSQLGPQTQRFEIQNLCFIFLE